MSRSELDQTVVAKERNKKRESRCFVRSDGFSSIVMKKLGVWVGVGMKEGVRKRSQMEWWKENCDGASSATGREGLGGGGGLLR